MSKSLTLIAGLISAVSMPLAARTFTSADGSKTIEAELVDFSPASGKIVIRNDGSDHNVTVDAAAFSKDDQDYFQQFLKDKTKRESIKISAEDKSEKLEEKQGTIYLFNRKNEFFNVTITNSGPVDLADLTANYDIYVARFDKQGKRIVEVVSGKESFSQIGSRSDTCFTTTSVKLTSSCASTSSCPKCKQHAASVKKERIIGIHVRLHDDKGQMLTEFHSTPSVKSAVEKKAKQS